MKGRPRKAPGPKEIRAKQQVSNAELARLLGVSREQVRKDLAAGLYSRRPDGSFDINEVARALQTKDPARAKELAQPVPGETTRENWTRVRVLRDKMHAQLLALEYEKKRGKLVDAKAVERIYVSALTDLRVNLESIPDRLAPLLVGLSPREIRDKIRDEIEAALRAASEVPHVEPEEE